MRRLTTIEFLATTVLVGAAATGFNRVFTGTGHLLPLLGAVVAATLISAVGMIRRVSAGWMVVWSAGGYAVYTTYAVLADTAPYAVPSRATAQALSDGLRSGWIELLSISMPAAPQPNLLVSVLALTWGAAALSAELVRRSRSNITPTLPALGLYASSLAFAAPRPAGSPIVALLVAGATLGVMLLQANRRVALERARPDDDGVRRSLSVDRSADHWVVLGLPVIAVALVGAAVLVPLGRFATDGRRPFDPRSLRDQDLELVGAASPVEALKAELALDPAEPPVRFRITVDGAPAAVAAVDRVRLMVLDRFDGATWSADARYTRAGVELPAASAVEVALDDVEQRITLVSPGPWPWLPAVARPRTLTPQERSVVIGVDADTGVVIAASALPDEFAYVVRSRVSQPRAVELAGLDVPERSAELDPLVEVPDLPASLRDLARRLTDPPPGTEVTPYATLLQLQQELSSGYGYDEQVPSGSSYGRLAQFLEQDRRGYAEQFAGAFAVLARSLGYPVRLVYGYRLTEPGTGDGTPTRLTEITSRQAHVWPEVLLGNGIWVAFEPTPDHTTEPTEPLAPPPPEVAGPSGLLAEQPGGAGVPGSGGTKTDRGAGDVLLSTPVLAALTVLATLVLLASGTVAVKRRRRRLRRRGSIAALQVLGAWAEVTDRLLEVGVAVDRSMTANEVAEASAARVPLTAVSHLEAMAPYVDHALFSPAPLSPARVHEMWGHAEAFRGHLFDGRHRYHRVAALLNPRPLLAARTRH